MNYIPQMDATIIVSDDLATCFSFPTNPKKCQGKTAPAGLHTVTVSNEFLYRGTNRNMKNI